MDHGRPSRRRTALPAVLLSAAAVALAGCSGQDAAAPAPASTRQLPAPSSSSPSSPEAPLSPGAQLPAALAAGHALRGTPGTAQDVVTGLDVPWSIAVLPDGSALISERDTARVLRVSQTGGTWRAEQVTATGPAGAVPDVEPRGEGGLLGLALSPSFAQDSWLYAYTTTATDDRVVRMRYSADDAGGAGTLSAPEPIITGITSATVHHGGRLAFGPDRMLYVTTGDASAPSTAQDPQALTGKVLRLTPDGQPAPGNPVAGSPVWTWGHRNPQGIGWDSAGRMFAAEFGQNTQDELNLLQPQRNYGWPLVEGAVPGPDGSDADVTDPAFTAPLVTWPTSDASPSGLLVTADAVYVAALRGQRLWRIPLDDGVLGQPEALLDSEHGRLRDVVAGPDGSLWVLTDNTSRGRPTAGDDRLLRLPLT
ncbi:Glucose/arabinose dehydrogenase, beta-propeller fold [Quadrisphaera granulorum]|uniref:Glucose/arabinose dehydrogenase n=1 Tax=Quadrisphaera granulorum TaxID=317664 RepID=A0A316AF10_9ACTN|nr:PQQ-dependent sugar dehydrogenase [Quadrisphaera granulorum]PWJ56323.1 glucose/arabinose dehydrogenase [Quadrisphaera granulorum]SZE94957.1 Glucose/arabinose dehydrogenase, beta-propeller fold [Quadrisphaera granulorum]